MVVDLFRFLEPCWGESVLTSTIDCGSIIAFSKTKREVFYSNLGTPLSDVALFARILTAEPYNRRCNHTW